MENFNFLPKEKQMAIFSEWKECQAIAKIKFGESYNHLYELYKGFIQNHAIQRAKRAHAGAKRARNHRKTCANFSKFFN